MFRPQTTTFGWAPNSENTPKMRLKIHLLWMFISWSVPGEKSERFVGFKLFGHKGRVFFKYICKWVVDMRLNSFAGAKMFIIDCSRPLWNYRRVLSTPMPCRLPHITLYSDFNKSINLKIDQTICLNLSLFLVVSILAHMCVLVNMRVHLRLVLTFCML